MSGIERNPFNQAEFDAGMEHLTTTGTILYFEKDPVSVQDAENIPISTISGSDMVAREANFLNKRFERIVKRKLRNTNAARNRLGRIGAAAETIQAFGTPLSDGAQDMIRERDSGLRHPRLPQRASFRRNR